MTTINVYYRRIKIFSKYPFQDEIETDVVCFSRTKKDFEKNIFLKISPKTSDKERMLEVSKHLGVKIQRINLLRY